MDPAHSTSENAPPPSPKRSQVILPFRINLSTEPYGSIILLQWVLLFLSIGLSLIFVMGLTQLQTIKEDTARFQKSVKRVLNQQNDLKATFEGGPAGSLGEKDILKEVNFANALIIRKSFSWTSFFSSLEEPVSRDISVSRVQPEGKDNGVQIEGKSLSLHSLTQFILELEKSPHFDTIFLANQKKDKEGRIQFLITFRYVE